MSTIDPGIGDAVQESSQDVEANSTDEEQQRAEEEEEDYLDPSRWWFASTACPLLAGTFGPIASAFNICALANEWRVYIPPGASEIHGVKIPDPKWLIAINAVSLVAALAGNISLLLNMARRLSFPIAQPITITGFLLAGVMLIVDMAALTSSPHYFLTGRNEPDARHALTAAFYYAIFAASTYVVLGLLMCVTVWGANKGYYRKDFQLTSSQRTLMLQTMWFVAYLLLGALVYSEIEGWNYLDAVFWADVTLLTVGFGDFSPVTNVGKGLLFPFAIGGILIIGLVIGSIRSLVLERGKEKLSARITEKRRSTAIHNVDERKQTIKISWFSAADFSTDPSLSPAQRREEEFSVMRKVQAASERERRWMALAMSSTFALILWFAGAAIFMATEYTQQWSYLDSLYFAYVGLLTIGYGDYILLSDSGRAFFVFWSILAVPSLTILISNMGDTIVKWFSDATMWVGSITVLPGEHGVRATTKALLENLLVICRDSLQRFSPPGLFGDLPEGHTKKHKERLPYEEHEDAMMDRLAERLTTHIEDEEIDEAEEAEARGDNLERDIHFYHYVLARECRNVQKDLGASPPRQYTWQEWEYFLKLVGNEDDPKDYPGQRQPDVLVPDNLRMSPSMGSGSDNTVAETDGAVDRETEMKEWKQAHAKNAKRRRGLARNPDRKQQRHSTTMDLQDWSWLSSKSPLMGTKSEAEWILERLSAALERELNRQRKGYRRQPPVSMSDVKRRKASADKRGGEDKIAEQEDMELHKAARGER